MKLSAEQRAQRLYLYGLLRSLSYVVRLNDIKAAQHFRARLAWVLRRPHDLTKPLHGDLKELFEISGLSVRNVGERHAIKLALMRRTDFAVLEAVLWGFHNPRPTAAGEPFMAA